MSLLPPIAAVCGVILAVLLLILGLRGRFGTPTEQGQFMLTELEHSDEIPEGTIARDIATCRGSTMEGHAPIGAGVLWLTSGDLGFVRRTPRRHLRIPLEAVDSAVVSSTYRREGFVEVTDAQDFLIVEWTVPDGDTDTIAWLTPDPERWAAIIQEAAGRASNRDGLF